MKKIYLFIVLMCCLCTVTHAQSESSANDSIRNKAYSLYKKAVSYDVSNIDSAAVLRSTLRRVIALYDQIGDNNTRISTYTMLAKSYFWTNNPDSAVHWVQQALRHYPTTPTSIDNDNYIEAKGTLAQFYLAQGKLTDAEKEFAELVELTRKLDDKPKTVQYLYFLGNVCAGIDKLEQGLAYCQEAVNIALNLQDYNMAAANQTSVATFYNKLKQFDEAVTASKLILEYATANGNNDSQLGGGWHIIGSSYFSLEKYNQAIEAFTKAAQHYEKAGAKELHQIAKSSIDYILWQTGKIEQVVPKLTEPQAADTIARLTIDTLTTAGRNSYEAIKLEKMLSDFEAKEKGAKFETLQEDYLRRQAETLRQRVWYISGLAMMAIALLILLYARQRQKTKAQALARLAEQKELEYITLEQQTELRMIQKYIDGLENERKRISKELHDGVCNDLLSIEMELRDTGLSADKLTLLSRSRESVRNISHELLPPEFQYASIDEILTHYISRLKYNNLSVEYNSDAWADWNALEREVSFAIYRIVQEALSNSIKHSGATKIVVSLSKNGTNVCLTIADNGTGIKTTDKLKGIGMQTIKERAASTGGVLEIDSSAQGTTIKINFQ